MQHNNRILSIKIKSNKYCKDKKLFNTFSILLFIKLLPRYTPRND